MNYFKTPLRVTAVSIATLLASTTFAADSSQHKIVNGVAIYLGMLPAEMILGHPKPHTEAEMHGGVPAGSYQYHVMVVLFDNVSGKRITGATVSARVHEISLAGTQKNRTHADCGHHHLWQLLQYVGQHQPLPHPRANRTARHPGRDRSDI